VPGPIQDWDFFSDGEYATNLIIANVKTLSHDDSNSQQLFFSIGLAAGEQTAWRLWNKLGPRQCVYKD